MNRDANNLGPRLGFAPRAAGDDSARRIRDHLQQRIVCVDPRQLGGQPPFADTETITATADAPLTLADALLTPTAASTNNWGVDRDYALGMIQTWNATLTRNLTQDWTIRRLHRHQGDRPGSCARRRSDPAAC